MVEEAKILTQLKSFESKQKQKLEKAKERVDANFEQGKKELQASLSKAKESARKSLEKKVSNTELKAVQEAKAIFTDYSQQKTQLDTNYRKNSGKAVKTILNQLIKG